MRPIFFFFQTEKTIDNFFSENKPLPEALLMISARKPFSTAPIWSPKPRAHTKKHWYFSNFQFL